MRSDLADHFDVEDLEAPEMLPYAEGVPLYPFTGMVVNGDALTNAHRDESDGSYCLVMWVCDCEGGELVLDELRQVMQLHTGDFTVFWSSEIMHFNMHYKGIRGSLVFHTNKDMRHWVKDHNGLEGNMSMSFSA